jgi:hypothetical protein
VEAPRTASITHQDGQLAVFAGPFCASQRFQFGYHLLQQSRIISISQNNNHPVQQLCSLPDEPKECELAAVPSEVLEHHPLDLGLKAADGSSFLPELEVELARGLISFIRLQNQNAASSIIRDSS